MRRYEILIFVTGAVTLALEVLASRIMTPYFGVSLYIWSGILSITLAFLAIGYHYGGRLSRRLSAPELEVRFLVTPVLSAASLIGATLLYPFVLPALSQLDLVMGSFVGATLLLALPLIALSAMNPLLIGLLRQDRDAGDAGAGRVFFISTAGSVAGVLLTAFVLIPNLSNFRALLALGLGLAAMAAVFTLLAPLRGAVKGRLLAASAAVAVPLALLLVFKDSYLRMITSEPAGVSFNVSEEFTSIFGNIKVIEVALSADPQPPQRLFVQDGLLQNRTTADNVSLSSYTYMLETLGRAYAPQAKRAVVLGLGAGIVPRALKRAGLDVSVVEINSDALAAATRHFGFDRSQIAVHLDDARTFVHRCRAGYDLAVVDLFLGDNTPDYLLTREFFVDLRRCLTPGGAVVMNAFLDETDEGANQRLFATVRTAFPRVFRYGLAQGNSYIVGTGGGPAEATADASRLPREVGQTVVATLASRREVKPEYFVGFEPVDDDHNIFSVLFARAEMTLRKALAAQLPPRLLVN